MYKILNFTVWFLVGVFSKYLNATNSATYVDWYNGFIQNLRKNNPEDSSILYVKFKRCTIFTFSLMLFLIVYSYKASFFHNAIHVIKTQWQRSPTEQWKNHLKNNLMFLKKINILSVFCLLCSVK